MVFHSQMSYFCLDTWQVWVMGLRNAEQVARTVLPAILNASIDLDGWKMMVTEQQELSVRRL